MATSVFARVCVCGRGVYASNIKNGPSSDRLLRRRCLALSTYLSPYCLPLSLPCLAMKLATRASKTHFQLTSLNARWDGKVVHDNARMCTKRKLIAVIFRKLCKHIVLWWMFQKTRSRDHV